MPVTEWRLRDPQKHALDFGGLSSGDYVEVPDDSSLDVVDDLTIAFTASVPSDLDADSNNNYRTVITKSGTITNTYGVIFEESGTVDFSVIIGGTRNNARGGSIPMDGTPFTVVCTRDASTGDMQIFVDGESVATTTNTSGSADATTNPLRLSTTGSSHQLLGSLDRVNVDARVWSQAEAQTYTDGGTVDDSARRLELALDDGSGTTATDTSGYGNDGTLNGSPEWVPAINPYTFDERLFDVELTDAYNRFARKATASLDDPDGTVRAEYPHPTPVELEVKRDVDDAFERRIGGFVAKPESAGDRVDLLIHSHDQWLKKADPVFRSYTDTLISTIVSELVADKTPLDTPSGNINVKNDKQIDADWSGEPLDSVLEELAAASAGEEFGATDDADFYFRPGSSSTSPRQFGTGEYFDSSFADDATREVNRVTIYYGGTSGSAIQVNDPESQKDLQQELGTSDPVVISAKPKSFRDVSSESVARRKGKRILDDRSEIQTGELVTWEGFGVYPGDVAHVEDPDAGVDDDFVIAEITYSWRDDETSIKLAENTDGVVDQLVAMSDDIQRIDSREANSGATITRFENLFDDVAVSFDVSAFKRTVPADQFTFGEVAGDLGEAGEGLLGDRRGDKEKLL